MRSFTICTLQEILTGWPNQGAEMGGIYSAHGGDEKCVQILAGNPE
jgi:hypothetical protein